MFIGVVDVGMALKAERNLTDTKPFLWRMPEGSESTLRGRPPTFTCLGEQLRRTPGGRAGSPAWGRSTGQHSRRSCARLTVSLQTRSSPWGTSARV